MRKIIKILLCILMLAGITSPILAEDCQVDKSKKATALDANNQTQVTLSLPASETNNKVEIVFVIDHSNYEDIEDLATASEGMLTKLNSLTALDISIGVVKFDGWGIDAIKLKTGTLSNLIPLKDNYDTILSAMTEDYSLGIGGTNTEQPIRLGNKMLADGDSTATKYLVVLSDFHSYVYEGSATIDGVTYDNIPVSTTKSYSEYLSNLENYTDHAVYNSWKTLKELYDQNGKALDGSDWLSDSLFFRYGANSYGFKIPYSQTNWVSYDSTGLNDTTPANKWVTLDYDTYVAKRKAIAKASNDTGEFHITGNQRSMLLTYDALKASIDAGYSVITYKNKEKSSTDWENICKNVPNDMLDDLETLGAKVYKQSETEKVTDAFNNLEEQIIYLIGSGTLTDNIATNFDVVIPGSGCPYTITVDGEALTANNTATNQWSFGTPDNTGKYPYVITYTPGTSEQFVVDINVPIERAKQLKISYTLQLLTEGLESGEYPTNASATLDYVDSNGQNPGSETFEIPTVIYTKSNIPNTAVVSNTWLYLISVISMSGVILWLGKRCKNLNQ